MTLASDQNIDHDNLPVKVRRMIELRDVVFEEWEKRVRARMKESDQLSRPLLIDTLPVFYDNIAETLIPNYPRHLAVDGNSLANEHGGERARLTKYDPQAVVNEYQILRWTLFDVLNSNDVALSSDEILSINASLDAGIREAVTGFSQVHNALRHQFVAALTHDLRGPLASVNTALELLLVSNEPAKMKSYAVKAMDNLNRMDNMIRSLLDSMVDQAGGIRHLALSDFDIADVVKEVHTQAAMTHGVQFQIFGGSVQGWWDREAIKRAIENLVGNAIKYGDLNKPVRISFTNAYERLILMVHNAGSPIPIDEQEYVFHIYNRTRGAKEGQMKGWGIGLAFVRGVAESHGGSIACDSAIERGTTFTLDIPLDCRPFQSAPTDAVDD
ncbi:sensor histidine kinase [Noviherbaspirillum malthae]|jgi:signal transduction histidine kinase|uniref:sensor histidine kinase n=1 Tax=Noviherbaspirillum malthae TaxID=1260987 RepID=UPI00188F6579|nr:HAMP domain-containing sensor histidine kinase [Noviherbaspirillum malthae]